MEKKNPSRKSASTTTLLLSQAIDFLPDPTFAVDLTGKVTVWNRAMEEMTGIQAFDMIGKGAYAYSLPLYGERRPILIDLVLHPDPDMDKKYAFVRREGDTLYAETVGLPSGRSLWAKASPIYDKTSRIIGAIESIRDITDRKQIEKAHTDALTQLTELIDFLPDPTFAIDLTGRVTVWNRAMEDLTLIPAKDMLGKKDYEYAIPFYGTRRPMLLDNILDPAKELREDYSYFKKEKDIVLALGEVKINSRKITLWGKARPIYDSQENIIGAIESVRDITEARQTEEALRQSEARYRDIFFNVSDLLYLHDLNGNFIETNLASKRSTGYTHTDLENLNIKDILPERFKVHFNDYIRRLLESGYDEGLMTIITKTGAEMVMEYRNSLIIDAEGRPAGVRGSARDITSRIRASRQLRKERDLTVSIVETSPAFYDAIDQLGRVLFMNQSMLNALGYSLPEVAGKDYVETFIPEEDRAVCRDAMTRMVTSREPVVHENQVKTRDGRNLLIQWQGKAVFRDTGELEFIFGIGIDVTDRRLLDKALRESEEKYRAIFENANEGIYQTTPEGRLLSVNPALARMFGFASPGEMIEQVKDMGRELYVNPRDREHMLRILREQGVVDGLEVEMRRQDKSTFWISIHLHGVYDASGNIAYLEGTNVDITKRKRAEEALRESEERFRRMAEVSPEIFWMATPDWGRTIYVSPAFERITGITIAEAYQNPRVWLDIVHVEDMDLVTSMVGSVQQQDLEYEFRIVRKEGSVRWINIRSSVVKDAQGIPLYLTGIAEDISERKRSEEEMRAYEARLLRSQKLEAIGTLAGGIAHDFNNILSAIIGYSELALDDLPEDNPAQDNIREVIRAGDRARDLVKQILTFSRQVETEYRPVKVQIIAKEALKLLRSSIPSTITITEHIQPDAHPVLADPTQIHQIIMNLCTNAYHAMLPAGGEMRISLEQLRLDKEFSLQHPGLREGMYLRLMVDDTGCGMDVEILKRVFDPFFTTKEKGKGTGLGLATVHGIVTSLGGTVFVSSTIAHGSTFEVYLPAFEGEPDDFHKAEQPVVQGKGETILLVDDEEAILQFSKAMLEHLGYKVESSSSSMAALKAFQAHPDTFDLVITDQTMPVMSGSTLAREILNIRTVPIILMTGYSETITPEEAHSQGIEEYLDKPFTKANLACAVRRCLKK